MSWVVVDVPSPDPDECGAYGPFNTREEAEGYLYDDTNDIEIGVVLPLTPSRGISPPTAREAK